MHVELVKSFGVLFNFWNVYIYIYMNQPDRPDERERIEAAGGRVINWNGSRVLGVLATSRSIGNFITIHF